MKLMKNLIIKYKELIIYGIFGVLTTLVNFITFMVCNLIIGNENYLISNVIAWLAAIIFAYVTNKLWVFESKSWERRVLLKEIPSFVSARIFSFVVEEFGLYFFIEVLNFKSVSISLFDFSIDGNLISKAIIGVIVVIMNYIFSKLFIFKKKKEQDV